MPNSGYEFFMMDGSLLPREELERFHQEREAQTACDKVTVIKLQGRRESVTALEVVDRMREKRDWVGMAHVLVVLNEMCGPDPIGAAQDHAAAILSSSPGPANE
jgi:hypothetical protein